MKIYVDVILFINFSFDLLILLSTSIILKRKSKFYRLMLGAFIGSLSILFLFINITNLELFIFKIIISIIMILVSFGYKNTKYFGKNILFLYTISIILGGFLYYLSCKFSYKNTGLVFYFKGLSINYIFLLITSPIILYIYIKETKSLKQISNNIYKVKLKIENKTYELNGFMDTGNNLVDPYFYKPIILINKKINTKNQILVPCNVAIGSGILKCVKGTLIYKNKIYDVYVGTCFKIYLEDVDCLLNNKLEGIC